MQRPQPLTDDPVARTLFQFALRILGMSVLQCLSVTVNAFWVGRYLGEAALTAVTNAGSIMFLLSGAALGVAGAATILVGQCVGAGRVADAKRVVRAGMGVFIILSVALTIAGVGLATPLLIAMNTTPESLPLAVSYTRVMFLALPLLYLFVFVTSILLGIGDSKTPLSFIALGTVLGAVLNPLFIFGAGEMPGGGVAGSALATLASQAVSLAALIRHLYRHRNPLCLYRKDFSTSQADWLVVATLMRKGVPMGAQIFVASFSAVLMIVLVNGFGVDTSAAYGASIQLWVYVQLPALSIVVAVSSMTAQSVGAQDWDRVRRTAWVGSISCAVVTAIVVLLIYAAGGYAYRLFLPEGSPALAIARHLNFVIMWSFVLMMTAMVLFAVVRATGAVVVPLLIHSLSLLGVRYPLAFLLIDYWQADAIWWSFSISCGVDLLLAALYYRYGRWRAMGHMSMVVLVGASTVDGLTTRSVD